MLYRTLAVTVVLGLVAGWGFAQPAANAPTLQQLQQAEPATSPGHAAVTGGDEPGSPVHDRREGQGLLPRRDAAKVLKDLLAEMPASEQYVTTMVEKCKLKIYGMVRTDFVHDTARTGGQMASLFVRPDTGLGRNDESIFSIRGLPAGLRHGLPGNQPYRPVFL